MLSFLSRRFDIVGTKRLGRDHKARPRRLQPSVDGMERRDLLSVGGSVVLSGAAVMVAPNTSASQNTVVVQYQNVANVGNQLDVQLNGVDHYFDPRSVSVVFFSGYEAAGNESFTNNTSLATVAYGGSGTNTFYGGSGMDEFIGSSGTNNFHAGTGYDILLGGTGTNNYYENANGYGIIVQQGASNNIQDPGGNYFTV